MTLNDNQPAEPSKPLGCQDKAEIEDASARSAHQRSHLYKAGAQDSYGLETSTLDRRDCFPFMKLAAELRHQIYEYHLIPLENKVAVRPRHTRPCTCRTLRCLLGGSLLHMCNLPTIRVPRRISAIDIFLTSKTIFVESMPVFYGRNEFILTNIPDLRNFLQSIGPVRRQYIMKIRIIWLNGGPGAKAPEAFRLLRECVRLKRLHLLIYPDLVVPKRAITDLTKMYGMNELKKVRGLQDLRITKLESEPPMSSRYFSVYNDLLVRKLKKALRSLKQPRGLHVIKDGTKKAGGQRKIAVHNTTTTTRTGRNASTRNATNLAGVCVP